MCETERKTRSRGRSAVPLMRLRWRSEMRFCRSLVVLIFIVSFQFPVSCGQFPVSSLSYWKLVTGDWLLGAGLPRLLLQDLACIAHALLLVGVGLAQRANVGGDLADQLPIDPRHRDVRLLVD